MPGFANNERLGFSLAQTASGPSEGRVIVCVETRGVQTDMRLVDGLQQGAEYPSIGLCLLPSAEGATDAPAPNAQLAGPEARDGLWYECSLPVGGKPHVLVPFLGAGQPGAAAGLQYTITVYSELPLADAEVPTAADSGGAWECELCEGGHGAPCPFRAIVEKMDKMEALMDERMRFLDQLECGFCAR